jgi:transcriptional regulator with XRE-family HTH domain
LEKTRERDWHEVGDRLKELRTQYGDTQERFIERLRDDAGYSVSLSAYNRMERGLQAVPRPDMPRIAKLDKLSRGPGWLAWGYSVEVPTRQSVVAPPQAKAEGGETPTLADLPDTSPYLTTSPQSPRRRKRGA